VRGRSQAKPCCRRAAFGACEPDLYSDPASPRRSIRARHSSTAREIGVHRLPFGSEAEGVGARQQVIIREAHLTAQQETLPRRQLALHHLQRDLDLRQRVRDNLLIGRDAELRKDVSLVRDVLDHVRVVVGIDCTDPLVHPRAVLGGLRLQRRRRPAPEFERVSPARRACRLPEAPLPGRRRCP
jgi:hypothetical protein